MFFSSTRLGAQPATRSTNANNLFSFPPVVPAKSLWLFALCLIATLYPLHAQVTEAWVHVYDSTTAYSRELATDVAVDAQGNVYVTGSSAVSLDGKFDYVTIKYNAQGNQQWIKRYNGPAGGDDQTVAIALDASGNVYVTGYSANGVIDNDPPFDPNSPNYDYATVKYSPQGEEIWVARYNTIDYSGSSSSANNQVDRPTDLFVDVAGNVYVTGNTATIKYTANGAEQWAKQYDNEPYDYVTLEAAAITVDGQNNVIVTGSTYSGGQYDNYNFKTIKYNTQGTQLWVKTYDTQGKYDKAAYVTTDKQGNVYVTGTASSGDDVFVGLSHLTIKYDGQGNQVWQSLEEGNSTARGNERQIARGIIIDEQGSVYVLYLTRLYSELIKYTARGAILWSQAVDSYANDFTVDKAGDVYVTGNFGTGYITTKVSAQDGELWQREFSSQANGGDEPAAIAVDGSSNVYVTGNNGSDIADNADIITVKYSQQPTQPATLRINCGGPTVTTGGLTFVTDRYYSSTSAARSFAAGEIANTTNDVIYQDYRNAATTGGSFSYNIPVTSGTYQVRLNFAEIYYNKAGERIFSVAFEGGVFGFSNIDVFAEAGGAKKMITKVYTLTITDGALNLNFTSSKGKAMISAIQVIPVSSAREGVEELEETLTSFSARPNPFTSQLTLQVAEPTGKAAITVVDLLGRSLYQQVHQPQNGQVVLPLAHLKAGVYVVKLQTDAGTSRTVRVVKQ